MAATSHDVARLAGVSQTTVSRAFRGDERVRSTTRQRIFDAAAALSYVPSEAGRSLSTRRTRQIAMVTELDNLLYPSLVAPLHDALLAHGYRMVILAERQDDASSNERLLDGSIDGAILTTATLGSPLPFALQARGIPFVQLNRTSGLPNADSVTADNFGGACSMGRLLLEHGHRDIAVILGPAEASSSRDREAGFRAALDEKGLSIPPSWAWRGSFSYSSGAEGLRHVYGRKRPTAVFCATDTLAIGAYNEAREQGLTVPDDLAIVGFDDVSIAAWPSFKLTTVRVDFEQMARRACDLLIARLNGSRDASAVNEVLPTQLVIRATHTRHAANIGQLDH